MLAQTIPLGIFVRAFVRALAQKEIYVVRAFCAGSEFFARTKEISVVRAFVRALLHSARTTVFSIVRALLCKCLHNVISFCAGIVQVPEQNACTTYSSFVRADFHDLSGLLIRPVYVLIPGFF